MSALQAILLGILQGVTEFLPISSSGHLVLARHLFGLEGEGSLFFNMMLHLGTVVAVIAAFYEDVWALIKEFFACIRDIFRGQFHFKTDNPTRKLLFMLIIACLPLLLVALLSGQVQKITEDNDIVVEGFCFLITSGLLFLACKMRPGKARVRQMRPQTALAIGVAQGIAALPGISRSGATISTGMIFGFDREFVVKFSFLLSIPAIVGGAVFEMGEVASAGINMKFGPMALGILAATTFGYLSIQFMRRIILSKYFVVFAWYTLAIGIIAIVAGIVMHIAGGGDPSSVTTSVASALSDSASPSDVASLLHIL